MSSKSMTDIVNDAVKSFRSSIPDYLAAGIVDMSTGMLLAVDTADGHPREVLDMLAAATFDLFQGRNVVMIEDVWKRQRNLVDDFHYFQEILINSHNLLHLFMRGTANPNIVAAIVCRRSVNLGMLFAQGRAIMKEMDSELA